jgi:hypothetical protein
MARMHKEKSHNPLISRFVQTVFAQRNAQRSSQEKLQNKNTRLQNKKVVTP